MKILKIRLLLKKKYRLQQVRQPELYLLHGNREYLLDYKFFKHLMVAVGPDFLVRYFEEIKRCTVTFTCFGFSRT